MIKITPEIARKIAVYKQRLAAPKPAASPEGAREVLQAIRCLQIDPIRAVERTQYLVLFSRLGNYPMALLDRLAYEENFLFEYWAHAASYVLAEDYPIHRHMMENIKHGNGVIHRRYKNWLAANQALRDHILQTIRDNGQTMSAQIEDIAAQDWESSGWTNGRNTTLMVSDLWRHGKLLVAMREGNKKYWDLPERVLPPEILQQKLPLEELVQQAAQYSLQALGVGTARHIKNHFIRNRYPGLEGSLSQLEEQGLIREVQILEETDDRWASAGPWYVHRDDLPLIDALQGTAWQPRTTLLSPFDNLICDRDRTDLMWNFFFRIEIYVPKKKRQWGYYVLPILNGERLIGRIDPFMDRKKSLLQVKAVYAEPGAPADPDTVGAIRQAIEQLAAFLGAKKISITGLLPPGWKNLAA
jgi:uncharacterized protein YcaQ